MAQPSKTGRMISALDLANRIASDAERYEVGMGVPPFITMSSGARKLLEEDPETSRAEQPAVRAERSKIGTT